MRRLFDMLNNTAVEWYNWNIHFNVYFFSGTTLFSLPSPSNFSQLGGDMRKVKDDKADTPDVPKNLDEGDIAVMKT